MLRPSAWFLSGGMRSFPRLLRGVIGAQPLEQSLEEVWSVTPLRVFRIHLTGENEATFQSDLELDHHFFARARIRRVRQRIEGRGQSIGEARKLFRQCTAIGRNLHCAPFLEKRALAFLRWASTHSLMSSTW
ncbi:hypothetical protein ASD14_10350 [Lysobacter sp. Root494]|nr:hypothetical protein ASD14_10350 [Lysobacter sp. Root494]